MKIPFEGWLKEQLPDREASSQFDEAIRCYQAGAYRAALVFSYLGLLRVLAGRLMNSRQPAHFPEKLWKTIQVGLRDDERWERMTFDTTVRTEPASLFLIDEGMRQQLSYWKARRNDAAHAKGNQLSNAHVEMLWLFIRSNLGRFVVNGGRKGLLERFRRHLDPTFTAPGTDFSDLVRQIPESMPPSEYQAFLSDLFPLLDSGMELLGELTEEQKAFLTHLEKLGNSQLLEAFSIELKEHGDFLLGVLLRKPSFVLNYTGDPEAIHLVWYDLLLFDSPPARWQLPPSLEVLGVMLRAELISASVRETAVLHVVGKIVESTFKWQLSKELLDGLTPFGFWDAVRFHAFEDPQESGWAARNISLTIEYMERYGVDFLVARTFCRFFPREVVERPDDMYSAWKCTELAQPEDLGSLKSYFHTNPDLFDKIVKLCEDVGLTVQFFRRCMDPTSKSIVC